MTGNSSRAGRHRANYTRGGSPPPNRRFPSPGLQVFIRPLFPFLALLNQEPSLTRVDDLPRKKENASISRFSVEQVALPEKGRLTDLL